MAKKEISPIDMLLDEKNTDNFYSAEGVLDQICTGLEGDMSAAYTEGYSKVMQSYKTKGNAENNEANRPNRIILTNEYNSG